MGRHGDIGDVERDVKPRPSIPSQVLGPPFFSSSLPVLQSRHQFVTPRPEKFEVCPDEGHKKSEALFATLRKPTAWLSPGNRTPELVSRSSVRREAVARPKLSVEKVLSRGRFSVGSQTASPSL